MKKIGFIGAFDKTDMIIYVAKLFAEIGKKVLIIDMTIVRSSKIYSAMYYSKSKICN